METRIKSSCCLVFSFRVLREGSGEVKVEDEGGGTTGGEDPALAPMAGRSEFGAGERKRGDRVGLRVEISFLRDTFE